jgi:hypothetical protein
MERLLARGAAVGPWSGCSPVERLLARGAAVGPWSG